MGIQPSACATALDSVPTKIDPILCLGRAEQVCVHHPAASRSDSRALGSDLLDDLAAAGPRSSALIRQSELGAPVDREITELLDQPAARKIAVEHDDHVAREGSTRRAAAARW